MAIVAPALVLLYFGVAASLVYLGWTGYALLSGWALPTTAPIRQWPIADWAARHEPRLGHALLTLAAFGALTTWLATLVADGRQFVEREQAILLRLGRGWPVPIVACLLVFSMSAMWAGLARQGDINWGSIGGLVAFSDPGGYMAGAYDQARDGVWNFISLRRPLAAGFRSFLLSLGGFSYASMLLLQAALVAAAICFAAVAVARWRGVWAGLAFFALTYIYSREFVPTALTEPLGLVWALFSIPFFIEALRGSRPHALVAFAAMTTALMIRMGSMFTIPALIIWIVWQFAGSLKERARVLALCITIVLGVFLSNSALNRLYGTNQDLMGSNFSYTLCGLTIGTLWSGCLDKLKEQGQVLPETEAGRTALMNSMALESFRQHPEIFFGRLFSGFREFLNQLPATFFRGYEYVVAPPDWLLDLSLIACIAGFSYLAMRLISWPEIVFWILVFASISASAAFVFYDDGRRVLAVTYPLLWLLFSSAFTAPHTVPANAGPREGPIVPARTGWMILTAAAFLFLVAPWWAHRTFPALAGSTPAIGPGEHVILGGRRISGFLVVADGTPLRNDVPEIHLSSFRELIKFSLIERYQNLVNPVSPPTPFGFIAAPRLGAGAPSDYLYIVPAEVMERSDVRAWRLQLEDWYRKPGIKPYWFLVSRAEPVP